MADEDMAHGLHLSVRKSNFKSLPIVLSKIPDSIASIVTTSPIIPNKRVESDSSKLPPLRMHVTEGAANEGSDIRQVCAISICPVFGYLAASRTL